MLNRTRSAVVALLASFLMFTYSEASFGSNILINSAVGRENCDNPVLTKAILEFRYLNTEIPTNSKVSLHYGWEVSDPSGSVSNDWLEIGNASLDPLAYQDWGGTVEKVITSSESSSRQKTGINFVFRITLPDGTSYYDKGTATPKGFYRAAWDPNDIGCFSGPPLTFKSLKIFRSERY
jgi:hypothetical protein